MSAGQGKLGDLPSLRALFRAKSDHPETLAWINEQLKRRNDEAANTLQMEVVFALRRAKAAAPAPAPDLLDAVLLERSLKAPHGRALHRYRVSDAHYEALKAAVQAQLQRGCDAPERRAAAHFVLFAAEWFRREYVGGPHKWESIADALNVSLPYADTVWLMREGLAWWRRRPVHGPDGAEERILSLALEGGFPVRLLESQQGWLLDHLRRATSRLGVEGADDPAAAVRAVQAVEHRIPQSFRGGEFLRLSAELAGAVARLRAEAQFLEPRSLPLSTRLDAARNDWRDDLPIRIEGEGARRLVDELISAGPDRLAGDARCRRLLLPTVDGGWVPTLELSLAGELRAPARARGPSRAGAGLGSACARVGDRRRFSPPGAAGE